MTETRIQRSTNVARPRSDSHFVFIQTELERRLKKLSNLVTRVTYHDTKCRGLVLIVFPGGARSFYHYCRIKGSDPIRHHIGRYPDIDVAYARSEADHRNGRIAKGEDLIEEERALRAEPTFGELFTDYVERYGEPNKRTWRKDLSLFRCHLAELSDRKISEITTEDLATLHRRIGHKHRHVANQYRHRLGRQLYVHGLAENPRRTWLRALRRANIHDCKLHDLRRTNASWQVILGSSLHVVGKALGHSSVLSTAIYGRLSSAPVAASVSRATAAMLAGAPVGLLPAPQTDSHE